MGRLDNKVAVITGAASGIGRGTAIRFAVEGASVVIADLNEEGGAASVRECRENGGTAIFQKTDVAAEDDIKAVVARTVKEFGKLDIIYNNAGLVGATGSIEATSVEDWDRTFAVLTRGVFLGPFPKCEKSAVARSSPPPRSRGSPEATERTLTAERKPPW